MFDPSTAVNRKQLTDSLLVEFDEASVDIHEDKEPRKHLGGSQIGSECSRELWYEFRWFLKPNFGGVTKTHGQMLRLFNRGHREEEPVWNILKQAGHTFEPVPTDQKQHRVEKFAHGHGGGSVDNIGRLPIRYDFNERLLYECKTAADAPWKKMKKDHVKVANWKYYVQMCLYGRKLGIKYALFIMVNKNTDELYIEFVILDDGVGQDYEVKANAIVESQTPPQKAGLSRSHQVCKYCNFTKICHDDEQSDKNCRSCKYATPEEKGEWNCNYWGQPISFEGAQVGCGKWVQLK